MAYAPKAEETALKKIREGAMSPRVQKLNRAAMEQRAQPRTLADMVELLTPKQVAGYLKCSQNHVYELVKAHELISQPDRSRVMIAISDLHDYLSRQRKLKYG